MVWRGSKCGGPGGRGASVPPRFGVWPRACDGRTAVPASATPPSFRTWRRLRSMETPPLVRCSACASGALGDHRQEVVEVASAVHVPEVGAAAFLHDELEAGAAPVIAEQATRERVRGASQEVVLISHDERTSLRPPASRLGGMEGGVRNGATEHLVSGHPPSLPASRR